MKDIKDYIHLYFGCEFIYGEGTFIRKNWVGIEEGNLLWGAHEFPISSIKLVLRRLESFTEQELVNIFKKISLLDLSECQFEHGISKDLRWVNAIMDGAVIDAMEYDGHLFYAMNNDGTFDPINSQWEIAAILLKYGFDLFNLIDSGLALDKDLLNHLK